jgi:photosystem II stability/assembly factor-like uncharacterized protein
LKKLTYFFIVALLALSSNIYSQWTFVGGIAGLPSGEFPSISVVSPTCAWIACGTSANGPAVYRTTNGGINWTTLPTTGLAAKKLFCIWAKDSLTAFVGDGGDAAGTAGGNAILSKTTDGGNTWTTVTQTGGTAGFINGIVFSRTNPLFGIAQSDPPNGSGTAYWVSKTTDGGNTWTTTNPPGISGAASAQNSIFVVDANFYGFGLNAGASRLDMTSNGGTSWFTATTGAAGTFTSAAAFADNKLFGISASSTSLPTIARTTNGGLNWTTVTATGLSGASCCKWVSNTNTCYMGGNSGVTVAISKSTNGGATWVAQTTQNLSGVTHMDVIRIGTTVYGYAICGDGSVLKLVETVTGVENPSSNVPSNYSLEQNYPNPFNPTTTINFSLPKASDVSLKVYDALGNEVMSLVSGFKNEGTHSVVLDASGLSSGMYFYKLQAGNFTATKKLTLIK